MQGTGSSFRKGRISSVRQEGDHLIYRKAGVARPLVIPKYRAIPVFVIKNHLRTAGMSRERYLEMLGVL